MNEKNPLGTAKVGDLLRKFAIPSIIAMLVSSLYNIVDQIFIGHGVGELGNAATNIAFPLSIACIAIALLFGIGGAAAFNIAMGQGEKNPEEKEKAAFFMGNSIFMLVTLGVLLATVSILFLEPLLQFFGAPKDVLPYAKEYTRITAFGFPLLIIISGGGHLIRADGRPTVSMICNFTGAVINVFLDALFVLVFKWGMTGAATATVIGQVISTTLVIYYLSHCKTIKLRGKHLKPKGEYIRRVMSLGMAPCSNQIAMMVVQIVMNKTLKYYGGASVYGEAIPIACSGIIAKVNMIFMSLIIGISQGLQPIVSFNYGAGKYERVKKAYTTAIKAGFVIAIIAFLMFQLIPRQIISMFGNGSPMYYQFAVRYFRVFLFFTFWNCLQPISSNFFTAIGKPIYGVFLSLTRQIIFLLPLLLLLPLFVGIDGVMYSGMVADGMAGVCAIVMILREFGNENYRKK